jgi:hypothetical protein
MNMTQRMLLNWISLLKMTILSPINNKTCQMKTMLNRNFHNKSLNKTMIKFTVKIK